MVVIDEVQSVPILLDEVHYLIEEQNTRFVLFCFVLFCFENWIINEIHAFNSYRRKRWDLGYWRLSGEGEVDVIINDCEHAFELKGSRRSTTAHFKGLRELRIDNPKVKSLTLVNLEERSSRTEDNIDVLPIRVFLEKLWGGGW